MRPIIGVAGDYSLKYGIVLNLNTNNGVKRVKSKS